MVESGRKWSGLFKNGRKLSEVGSYKIYSGWIWSEVVRSGRKLSGVVGSGR